MAGQVEQEILATLSRIEERLDTVVKQGVDHETRLRSLEGKGGGRWERFIDFIIAAGVGALVTGIVTRLIQI